ATGLVASSISGSVRYTLPRSKPYFAAYRFATSVSGSAMPTISISPFLSLSNAQPTCPWVSPAIPILSGVCAAARRLSKERIRNPAIFVGIGVNSVLDGLFVDMQYIVSSRQHHKLVTIGLDHHGWAVIISHQSPVTSRQS